jgi:hydroxymethylglutaryl-CoA reductase (NADPH)
MSDISFASIAKQPHLNAQQRVVERQKIVTELVGDGDRSQLFTIPKEVEGISDRNCENLIGQVAIPVGVVGPMPVTLRRQPAQLKQFDQDTEVVTNHNLIMPLATTEGALVASVNRGCKAIKLAGGAQVITEYKGISRAPVFVTQSGLQAKQLVDWFVLNQSLVGEWAAKTSNHLHLVDIEGWVRGRYAYVRFVADTDQAMGMNMISIAIQSIWLQLQDRIKQGLEPSLVGIDMVSLSSNVCSDKKAGAINGLLGRGHWVQAEVILPSEVVRDVLKTSIEALVQTHRAKNEVGSALAGSLAQNMQVANVVAAIFAATGQDLAHVVDASQATTIIEPISTDSTDQVYI